MRRTSLGDEDENGEAMPKKLRKKKAAVENQFFKSAAFIDDSDDNEEADRLFFEREKALRQRMYELAEKTGNTLPVTSSKPKRSKAQAKAKARADKAMDGAGSDGDMDVDADASQADVDMSDAGGSDESGSEADSEDARPAKRKSSPVLDEDQSQVQSEVDDQEVTIRSKRNGRSGKVVDSESEDE